MMAGFLSLNGSARTRLAGLLIALVLMEGAGTVLRAQAAPLRRPRRPPARVVTIRQVVIRREPVIIQAVTLAQLRAELRRARLAQVGYEREVARQYGTIQHLQARLDLQMRAAQEAAAQRAAQLDARFEIILQAFGLVIFAIIGALLVALSRSQAPGARTSGSLSLPTMDWDPLRRQLRDAKGVLSSVEMRLRRLETTLPKEADFSSQ